MDSSVVAAGWVPARVTAASASTSSAADRWLARLEAASAGEAGMTGVAWLALTSLRARRHPVTPRRVSTAKPRGNAAARACSAAWRSCFVAGVQPATAITALVNHGLLTGGVSDFWTAGLGSGSTPARSSGGARARRTAARSCSTRSAGRSAGSALSCSSANALTFVGDLVSAARARLARRSARRGPAHRARRPPDRTRDANTRTPRRPLTTDTPVDPNTSHHLVFDLHRVAGVEELLRAKRPRRSPPQGADSNTAPAAAPSTWGLRPPRRRPYRPPNHQYC